MTQNVRNSANRIPKARVESLTDLIFGLALSIGAVSLLSKPPATPGDVISDLLGFGFSFLILMSIWFRYTNIISILPFETTGVLFLNAILLFLVSVEPYLLSILAFGSFQSSQFAVVDFASQAYALDLAGLMAVLGFFAHQVAVVERKQANARLESMHRRTRDVQFFSAALFVVTTLHVFWIWTINGTALRFYVWYAILLLTLLVRLTSRLKKDS